jgi:hypothetical protein
VQSMDSQVSDQTAKAVIRSIVTINNNFTNGRSEEQIAK